MLTKMMEGMGDRFAERWIATLLTPAFFFWAGGFLLWVWHAGWQTVAQWFTTQPQPVQVTIAIAAFLVVTSTAYLVQRFDQAALSFLEGYWPGWLRWPRECCTKRQARRLLRRLERYQELLEYGYDSLSAEELNEYIKLDQQLMYMPRKPEYLMPTAVGNILRAAELRPRDKYGLEAVVCWPRLWLLLPGDVKKELEDARALLDTAVRSWSWSLLFLIWVIWAWWAIPVSLFAALCIYRWIVAASRIYGELLDATFDLYRIELYIALRWPLPKNPDQERLMGDQITQYLWRGAYTARPSFKTSRR